MNIENNDKKIDQERGKKLYKRWYVWLLFYPAAIVSFAIEKYKNGQKAIAIGTIISLIAITVLGTAIKPDKNVTSFGSTKSSKDMSWNGMTRDEWENRCFVINKALDECASAGNIENCLSIKLDSRTSIDRMWCNKNGPLWDQLKSEKK